MRAVLLRVRSMLRRRWGSALFVACIVAIVTATVLALAAGARRTASTPDALTAAVGGDPDAYVEQQFGPPLTAEVAALPIVESVDAMTFTFAALIDAVDGPADGTISFAGERPSTARLVAGRDPTDIHEFTVDQQFVDQHEARLGDRYRVVTLTQAQVDRGQYDTQAAQGPSFEAELVGVFETVAVLDSEFTHAVFPLALLELGVPSVSTLMNVDLFPGVTIDQLRDQLDKLPDRGNLSVEPSRVVSVEIRNAVEAQAQGILVMAAVSSAAAVVALGQLLTRHVRLGAPDRSRLIALGYTKGQLGVESVARAAVPAAAGVGVGAMLAVLTSGRFPAGFVRDLDPDPGLRVDVGALAIGGAALLIGMLGWVAVALLASGRAGRSRSSTRSMETIARRAPSPAAATGTRFAYAGHDGSSRIAIGSWVLLAVLVGGVVGSAVFAASLDRLVTDRGQFGSNFDLAIGDIAELSAEDYRSTFADDPDVAGLMILTSAQVRAGKTTVGLIGVEHVRGDLAPRLLSGRLPQAPDEVALGQLTARQLDLQVDDAVELAAEGEPEAFRVVGVAVVPTFAGIDGVGQGAVATADGLQRLEPSEPAVMAAITLRPGAPADFTQRFEEQLGLQPTEWQQSMPGAIINVARVRSIPALLAGILVGLALLTLVHGLIVSIQRRRRDLAVLSALGADRRFIARTVHWQATALTVLPLVLGVPLGLIAGSYIFRAFADRIGAVPDPARPLVVIVATTLGIVGVANLAAVVPARRARRSSTAEQLRIE